MFNDLRGIIQTLKRDRKKESSLQKLDYIYNALAALSQTECKFPKWAFCPQNLTLSTSEYCEAILTHWYSSFCRHNSCRNTASDAASASRLVLKNMFIVSMTWFSIIFFLALSKHVPLEYFVLSSSSCKLAYNTILCKH